MATSNDRRRRPGRPPLDVERRRNVGLKVFVTAAEADAYYSLARRLDRTLSDILREKCADLLREQSFVLVWENQSTTTSR